MEVYVPDYYKRKSPVFLIKCLPNRKRIRKRWPYFQKNFPVVPPKVEYKLSERGRSLENILRSLDQWGVEDNLINGRGCLISYELK
jgi:hypothetical protein